MPLLIPFVSATAHNAGVLDIRSCPAWLRCRQNSFDEASNWTAFAVKPHSLAERFRGKDPQLRLDTCPDFWNRWAAAACGVWVHWPRRVAVDRPPPFMFLTGTGGDNPPSPRNDRVQVPRRHPVLPAAGVQQPAPVARVEPRHAQRARAGGLRGWRVGYLARLAAVHTGSAEHAGVCVCVCVLNKQHNEASLCVRVCIRKAPGERVDTACVGVHVPYSTGTRGRSTPAKLGNKHGTPAHARLAVPSHVPGRIFPCSLQVDEAAVQRYNDILDACEGAGLVPMLTLHHFTHPQWFQQLGGFEEEGNIRWVPGWAASGGISRCGVAIPGNSMRKLVDFVRSALGKPARGVPATSQAC